MYIYIYNTKASQYSEKAIMATVQFKRLLTFIYEMRIVKSEKKETPLDIFQTEEKKNNNNTEPILYGEHFSTSPINNNELKIRQH